ncbi:hypothetical protein ME7_00651 [Bartonella birtlesii LL-WM9]|uniref:Uncharacterized protein n=1 Tax=Bartonella birtlesii LL-WM9 TaxID=1094552 RepID=J0PWC2_9HYPH|nr:hypothetical protein ME7_00651 [Bartonella birtlesii LL-WM9]
MFTDLYNPRTCLGDAGPKRQDVYGSSHFLASPFKK